MILNYSAVRIAGSCVLGGFFAFSLTVLIYLISGNNKEILVLFLPLSIILIRAVLWGWDRSVRANSDAVRRHYEAGDPPLGR
jgi:hypothetical protein